jgi:predicted dehydrogenase
MKRFLLCGLGSIGQRHARILRQQLGDQADLHAYRSRGFSIVINDDMTAMEGASPEAAYAITPHTSLPDSLSLKPDAVFVTNPISEHVKTALAAARAGCHIFMEKPVGHDMTGIAELLGLMKHKDLVGCSGYQLRFHPALAKIKEWLNEKVLGRVIHAHLHFGEWLPGMHPYEDYHISHASRADQGGGVILCLSHEIDYACWLFGWPRMVTTLGGTLGDLGIDVEDTADLQLSCGLEGCEVPVNIHLDFLQKPPQRNCLITGTKGVIEWSYYSQHVTLSRGGQTETFEFPNFVRNDMFQAQTANFLAAIDRKEQPVCSIADGVKTLQVCLAARESLHMRQAVHLNLD